MRNRSTEYGVKICVSLVASACYGTLAFAGTTPLATGPALADGIFSTSNVVYSAYGTNGIKAAFPQQSAFAPSDLANVAVDQGVEGSAFFGDYIDRGINAISLEVSGSGHQPPKAEILLTGATKQWRFRFGFPTSAGTVSSLVLPLKTADGWTAYGTSGLTADELSARLGGDLVDVSAISVLIYPVQDGFIYPEQYYVLDNFVLINDDGISSLPANLTPAEKALQSALIARFGYGYGAPGSLTDEMKGWDSDGDGMADFMELWSENDRDYANSIFSAEDIEVVGDNVKITWTCVAGDTYTVVRADSLNGSFLPVSGLTAEAAGTGYMTLTDTGAPAGCYYRIRKH